ncbi:N-acetylmuramoyl-L-alanine amidase [uncultured Clostridium sp.]|uniref:N-acetylmuramoyl-L-alanine amidase n=1 Tax=uncultured Clostridium sp. TaxID=59620 RepID=UPI00261EDBBE|nr:N-acetylmuramoyl-L-alanine amidase [uncultured Clostridium sp.]
MKRLKIMLCIACVLSFGTTTALATGIEGNDNKGNETEIVKIENETDNDKKDEGDILGVQKVEGNIVQENLDDESLSISLDEYLANKEKVSFKQHSFAQIEQKEVQVNKALNIIETNFNWNGDLDYSNNPKKMVLHHIEASRPDSTIPVTDIHNWHLANGWTGIGYHFYITKDGRVFRGRPENAVGAHAKGVNAESIGIAVEGKYDIENMPEAQKKSVIELGKYLKDKYNMKDILKHKDVNSTDCPGKNYPFESIKTEILKENPVVPPVTPPITPPVVPPVEDSFVPPINEEANTRPIVDKTLKIKYQVQGEDYGWQNSVYDGALGGTEGQWKRMEGIKINLENAPQDLGISYRTHSAGDSGWRSWKNEGELSGTVGEWKRMEAIQIKLNGKIAENYDIKYRVHVADKGWLPWVKNGETAGTMGEARRIEGIEIKIESSNAFGVEYQVQGQDYGWQKAKRDGQLGGTEYQWRRMEGIKINLKNAPAGVGIKYSTHSAGDPGWREWKTNGQLSGTIGEWRRMEAIKIELTGSNASKYNIEYRVQGEDYGWQSWVKNGQMAGSMGQGRRMEGIEIRIVKK